MKNVKKTLAAATLAVLLAFPGSSFARQDKNIKMTFEVVDGALELKQGGRYTTPSNCSRNDHPGCYDISNDQVGKFRLTLHRGNDNCDDDEDWEFYSVVLGGEGDIDTPQPKPSASDWGGISQGAAADFDADEDEGKVNIIFDGKKRVTFEDQNNHSFSIWYKVIVQRCDESEILEYDPRIENRGLPES